MSITYSSAKYSLVHPKITPEYYKALPTHNPLVKALYISSDNSYEPYAITDTPDNIIKLVLIHKNICKYDTINNTKTLLNELTSLTINVINQIAFTTTQIEFIKLNNSYLLPINPLAIRVKQITNKFKILNLTINKFLK